MCLLINPLLTLIPGSALSSEIEPLNLDSTNSASTNKIEFPISIGLTERFGETFNMQSTAVITKDGHITGTTMTTLNSFATVACGRVAIVLQGENESENSRYNMTATDNSPTAFCVSDILPHYGRVRIDTWKGKVPEEVISTAASVELIHSCIFSCR